MFLLQHYFLIVCMYVCMYVCIHVRSYVRMHVCMYVCMYACLYVCMYLHLYLYGYWQKSLRIIIASACACMHVRTYVRMCACMHTCMFHPLRHDFLVWAKVRTVIRLYGLWQATGGQSSHHPINVLSRVSRSQ